MADAAALRVILIDGDVRIEPFAAAHLEPLRHACAADPGIWQIMPRSMLGEAFDPEIASRRAADAAGQAVLFAARLGSEVVGTTAYLRLEPEEGTLELGGTYIVPRLRGSGYNGRMKRLLIDHAFACGFRRIEFRIDERNARSQAAVAKLGAVREGLLRQDRVTWTGHLRSTCVFGLLREEWRP